MSDISSPQPFQVEIPQEEVERMNQLVAHTRLPDKPPIPEASWEYGVDLKWLKELKDAWVNDFDWKEVEREMNAFSHYTAVIESVTVHFIHQRSSRPDAIPIILMHGWPGSFWEFHKMIDPLTNPPAGQPAFHVVVPSLPGFGFSSAPPRRGWSLEDNARIFDHLMTGVLKYPSYMSEGVSLSSLVSMHLGSDKYPACKMLGVTTIAAEPTLGALLTLPLFLFPKSWRQWAYGKIYSEEELADFARNGHFLKDGLGYIIEQATRPLSVGYALHDSPIGLLAWLGEKYVEHLDPESVPQATHFILTTVSLYYLTGTFMTSTLPYYENTKAFSQKLVISKPVGLSRFPYDVGSIPVSWIKRQHPGLVFTRRHQRGGHFPGYEAPDLLTNDLREMASSHDQLFVQRQ